MEMIKETLIHLLERKEPQISKGNLTLENKTSISKIISNTKAKRTPSQKFRKRKKMFLTMMSKSVKMTRTLRKLQTRELI